MGVRDRTKLPGRAPRRRGEATAAALRALSEWRTTQITGAAFVAPAIVVLLLIAGFPLFYNVFNSFRYVVLSDPGSERFVGLANYERIVTSPDFLQPLLRTVLFTVVSVALEMAVGMVLALVMHRPFRGRGLVRAAVLVPWAVPTVVSGMLWKTMFDPVTGFVDYTLGLLHLPGATTAWLNGVWTSWAVLLVADAWKNTPFVAILLLAGLQVIPDELYEQGRIDGAGMIRRFLFITLPMLKPAILVALIFRTLQSFLIFDVVKVITGGGPGNATETLGYLNWSAFLVDTDFGFGGAISVALVVICVGIALTYQRVMRPST
jgi:ABC-type sugar transport system permease subunit